MNTLGAGNAEHFSSALLELASDVDSPAEVADEDFLTRLLL